MTKKSLTQSLALAFCVGVLSGCATKHLKMDLQLLQGDLDVCEVTADTLGVVADTAAAALETTVAVAEWGDMARQLAQMQIEIQEDTIAQLEASFDAGDLEIVTRDGQMVLQLPGEVLFAQGETSLTDEGRDAMARVAAVIRDRPGRFLVAGHTDDVPVGVTPRYSSNRELSILRSLSAVEVLESEGVAPDQLVAAGFGEHQPLHANSSDDKRASNRRLEIVFIPQVYGNDINSMQEVGALFPGAPLESIVASAN